MFSCNDKILMKTTLLRKIVFHLLPLLNRIHVNLINLLIKIYQLHGCFLLIVFQFIAGIVDCKFQDGIEQWFTFTIGNNQECSLVGFPKTIGEGDSSTLLLFCSKQQNVRKFHLHRHLLHICLLHAWNHKKLPYFFSSVHFICSSSRPKMNMFLYTDDSVIFFRQEPIPTHFIGSFILNTK